MEFILSKKRMLILLSSLVFIVSLTLAIVILISTRTEPDKDNNISKKLEDAVFANMQYGIKSLTTIKTVTDLAAGITSVDNLEVLNTLDTANSIFDSSLIYIVDTGGTVIASTTYDDGKTLTGNNYSFRPYVQSALSGESIVYPALGVTTLERGLYFSSPIYSLDNESIIGLVVIKIGLKQIDKILSEYEDPIFLITPNGIVFASNQLDMVFHYAYPLSDDQLFTIHESRQFADKILKPLPAFLNKDKIVYKDREYIIQREMFLDARWEIAVLQSESRKYVFDRNAVFSVLAFMIFLMFVIFLLARNIMIRRKIEIALRKSKETYQTLFSLAPDGISISTFNGEILSFNEAYTKIFKYPPEKLKTMNVRELYKNPDEDRALLLKELLEKRKLKNYALDLKDAQNKDMITINSFALIDYQGEECIESIIRDMTDIEEKEQLLRQAQKMEILGILSSGLVHDFNNMVGGISGNISLLRSKIDKHKAITNEELNKCINRMEVSIKRSGDLVHQLLSLSRKKEYKAVQLDLNESIKHVTNICHNSLDKSIEIVINYYENSAIIYGDPTQIEQVILNLCINASHAMTIMRTDENNGGRLTVSLEKRSMGKLFHLKKPDDGNEHYWVLSVQDSGVGIKSDHIEELFKPFFTTKENNKGTGLGLLMVKNIIEQHHGYIDVHSEIGIGTSFYIYLPLIPA